MAAVQPHALPDGALLARYRESGYTDCFATELPGSVTHAEYVEAFYTTAVFKLERRLLAWFVSKPSTDGQARELATGAREAFSAWDVEDRRPDQLLMRDVGGRARSWLMVAPTAEGELPATRLYFGSAVVPAADSQGTVRPRMGFLFHALLGFHKLYSRVLLHSARSRVARSRHAR